MDESQNKKPKYIIFSALIMGLLVVVGLIKISQPRGEFITDITGNYLFQTKNTKAFEAKFGVEENTSGMVFSAGDSEIKIKIPYQGAKWEKTEKGLRVISDGIIYDYSIIEDNKKQSIGIKEEIILNQETAYSSFVFPSFFKNLNPEKIDGIWKFFDNDWKEKFYIPKPFMIDANNNKSENVEIEVSVDGKFIKITPNEQWLRDKNRAYPIIIDPSLVVPDNPETINQMMIESPEPTQSTISSVKLRSLDNNIIEIGTEKYSPPKPFIKLNKWGEEVFLKVTIPVEVNEQPIIGNNKLRYQSLNRDGKDKIDIDIYLKQPETITETDSKGNQQSFTINESGGVEFDTILYEKPSTNKIVFGIETQGLKFYYQPALTQEEIDEGASGPENVVGSYAVYHSTKKGDYSQIGGKNYMAGKAFHIYRPKITDADGKEIWGELNIDIDKGILSITIPHGFLDKAVYPIIVDPTFGYESIPALYTIWAVNTIRGDYPYSPVSSGTITQLSIYFHAAVSGGLVRPVIYKNSDNSLIGYGGEVNDDAAGWKDLPLSSGGNIVANTEYMLGLWLGGSSPSIRYDTVTDIKARHSITYNATNAPPDPCTWSAGKPALSYAWGIYATYSEAAADKIINLKGGRINIKGGTLRIK